LASIFLQSGLRLKNIFNTLIDSYLENKVGIVDNFLSESLAGHLKENLITLFAKAQLQAAGTGQKEKNGLDNVFRGDQIYWLGREHDDIYENTFFDLMDHFVEHINSTCYAGIKSYEFHYTLYPTGSFYKVHLDQFKTDDSRQYSMIMYLNEGWEEKDGGELCVHDGDARQNISPINGKSVFFKSNELKHEVLLTHKPRMSITGWLKR
jgi:SM-20-related protein